MLRIVKGPSSLEAVDGCGKLLQQMSQEGKQDSVGSWLTDTYWYVPALYLPALLAIQTSRY
jgi:hypothetical protein